MDKNLVQRLITGSIFVIVLVGAILWNVWSMTGLFLLITVLGTWEFYRLAEKAGVQPQKVYGTVVAVLLPFLLFFYKMMPWHSFLVLSPPLLFLPFFIELFRKKENPFANIGWTLLGIFYVALPFCLLLFTFVPWNTSNEISGTGLLHNAWTTQYDYRPVLLIFILIWISDSLAYVCGRLFGKHKLFERISPKKTWEGFIGGFIFTVVAAGFLADWLAAAPGWPMRIQWICVAAVISVTGMLGDLSESLFKRSINVKDSGTILPGHGGILDRFDALLLATPFAISAYWICGQLL